MPAHEPNDTMVTAGAPGATGFGAPAVPGEVGTLGPYRLIRELGKGGMGAVYAALDTRLDRRLALKVMLPEFAADRAAKERFIREAKAVAKIAHDNVVTIYEADERDGVPYIAMQYLEGYPLDEFLKSKGALTVQQVVRIATETASGLAAAHALGLVHRDIKPANLWLEAPHGRVKVLDFGLAKPVDTEVELTKSGAVVGTPAYMSPEQARGERVDARSDLFSLGSVLYKLCTGAMPFTGPTTMAVLMALGTEEPRPVRELNPDVPESLAELVHQLLAKKPVARPQSASELVARLRSVADELGARAAAPTQPLVMMPQVVYAVTPVSGASANPFADLDSPDTERESREPSDPSVPALEPARRPRWPLYAAGGAALVAVAVVVALALNGGSATDPKPDDTAKKQQPPKAAADSDRKVAEWVLGSGGAVRVNGDGRVLKAATELPPGALALTAVNFDGAKIDGMALARLKGVAGLKALYLYQTPVTDADAVHLEPLRGLTVLNLNNTAVSDAGLKHLAGLTELVELELMSTKVADAGMEHLKALTKLRSLNLIDTGVSGSGLAHLSGLTDLSALLLANKQITDDGVRHVAPFRKLTVLNLDSNPVSDAGLVHLAALDRLTDLGLNGTRVTDGGLASLKALQGLKSLGLRETNVTDAGAVLLSELQNLTHLDVRKTRVTDKGLAALRAALPGCRIEHDGGVIEAVDADRNAAEWVLSVGGSVRLNNEGKDRKAVAELPKEGFALTGINLNGSQATDAGLAQVRGLKNLKELALGCKGLSNEGLIHLRELVSLTYLEFSGMPVSDAGLVHIKELKNLTRLYLNGTKVSDTGLAHLKELKGLMFLNLAGAPVSDAGLKYLGELKNLKHLFLDSTEITDAGLGHLAKANGLELLNVKRTAVTPKGSAALHAAVPWCRVEHDGGVIQAIDVNRKAAEWVLSVGGSVRLNNVTKEIQSDRDLPKEPFVLVLVALAKNERVTDAGLTNLRGCKQLWNINLGLTPLTDAGLAHISECPGLRVLNVYSTDVGDAGLAHLKGCTGLQVLNLHRTKVTDAGFKHLKELKQLTELRLADTAASDAGLEQLNGVESLRSLNLSGTLVTDAGLAHLRELKGLTSLDVRKTKVTAKGVADLAAALPSCRIEYDGGVIEPKK